MVEASPKPPKGGRKRGAGRPPLAEPRTIPVTLRFSEAEARFLFGLQSKPGQALGSILVGLVNKLRRDAR